MAGESLTGRLVCYALGIILAGVMILAGLLNPDVRWLFYLGFVLWPIVFLVVWRHVFK